MKSSLGLILILGLLAQQEAPASRLKVMRGLASGVTIKADDGAKSLLVAEPIYRFADPARDTADGSTWAFGKSGRPTSLMTIALDKEDDGRPRKLIEFTSLASGPIEVDLPGDNGPERWRTAVPGITPKPVPDATAPGDDESKRLRQMKDIARRFKAFEHFEPKQGARAERYELRLLPQPMHRYRDPASGLMDGAIFFLAYGNNPEVALVIEARREGKAEPTWTYGMNRMAGARVVVNLDDRQVMEFPKDYGGGPQSGYGVVVRRLATEGD